MNEQKHIAETFLEQGELCLLKRELSGLEFFRKAAELDPKNSQLFFRQALSLYEYAYDSSNESILLLASKKLKRAAFFEPPTFAIWHLWGNILSHLGKITKRHHFFLEAKEKFIQAVALSSQQPNDILSDLFWEYGIVWHKSGEHSQEALDFQLALEAFEKASFYCNALPADFWHTYGQTALALAQQINDIRLYMKAIHCFKQSISTPNASYTGWKALAQALKMLYSYTHDEDHFSQANECFSAAAQLYPQEDITLWFDWAQFLCEAGRRHKDIKKLRSCIEKCHRAPVFNPTHSLVIGIWAEALAMIGELSDRVDLIYEAQNKIAEASLTAENNPDIWFSYGMCLNSLAEYFDEIDYIYQAIEKFQQGLSIDRTCHRHWHAIANAYAHIGIHEEDLEFLERSCRFYNKAIDLHPSTFYIYDYALVLSKLGEITESQKWLEESIIQFERALNRQKNAAYLHPEWLFHYATTLDMLGDFHEEKSYYIRSIEILSHVLMIDPDFPDIHYQIALSYSHLSNLIEDSEYCHRAIHHYRLALKHDEESDQILTDWSITLINLAEYSHDSGEIHSLYREAEHKLIQAAKLGNVNSFYHLACLYSLIGNYEQSLLFIEKADNFNALPLMEELLEDDWLEGLRATPNFRAFLSQLEKKPHLHEER